MLCSTNQEGGAKKAEKTLSAGVSLIEENIFFLFDLRMIFLYVTYTRLCVSVPNVFQYFPS